MFFLFDILLAETGGSMRWLETVATLEDAETRVQELAVRSPGEYVILNQRTGNKRVIKFDGVDEAPGP